MFAVTMFNSDPPPVVDQGVIVATSLFHEFYRDSAALVLTPRCDIAQEKAEFLTLCAVVGPEQVAAGAGWRTLGRLRDELGKIMGGQIYRWHWLDPFGPFQNGAVVDFELVVSVALSTLNDATGIAELASTWREQIATRYAAYAGRIGVPSIPKAEFVARRNEVAQHVLDALPPLPAPDAPTAIN